MHKYMVTIARQYGSGGREIGKKLSEVTGFRFYDKDLITMAAQKSGLSQAVLDTADEKAANSLLYTLALGSSVYHHGVDSLHVPLNDKLFTVQSEIIKEISENNENAIFVGRCADYVLSSYPQLIRVFIRAEFDTRVKNIMKRHDLTENQAKELIIKTDKRRANYYNYYTGGKWAKIENYDLVLSTDKTGMDGAVKMITSFINIMDQK